MDTDEIILWVCLGVAGLLMLIFLIFAVTSGGIKAFLFYILFPLFVISFLVGMVLLVQLIIKLNDKLDGNTNGLNKKIDTNNFMIKDTIANVDDYLQNVDYTVIIEDRNVIIDPNNPEDYGTPYRYKPQLYEPSLEIPGVTGPEGLKSIRPSNEVLSENNVKSVIISQENNTDLITPIVEMSSKENVEVFSKEEIDDSNSITESLSVNETIDDSNSIAESLSVNETIDELSNNSILGSIDDLLSLFNEPLEYYEVMKEIVYEDKIEDDNTSVFTTSYNLENLYEIKPLHEEFLNFYDFFNE